MLVESIMITESSALSLALCLYSVFERIRKVGLEGCVFGAKQMVHMDHCDERDDASSSLVYAREGGLPLDWRR